MFKKIKAIRSLPALKKELTQHGKRAALGVGISLAGTITIILLQPAVGTALLIGAGTKLAALFLAGSAIGKVFKSLRAHRQEIQDILFPPANDNRTLVDQTPAALLPRQSIKQEFDHKAEEQNNGSNAGLTGADQKPKIQPDQPR